MRNVQQLPENGCQRRIVGFRARGQDAKVGAVGARYIGVGLEMPVEPLEHRGGKECGAVRVVGKGAGLARELLDQVTPVDRLIVASGACGATDDSAVVKQFDALQPYAAGEALADGRVRHRIVMAVNGDQAAGAHRSIQLHKVRQTTTGKGVQEPLLLLPCFHACGVAAVQHAVQELHVLTLGLEVPAAAKTEGDVQLQNEMAVCRFDRAVFVGLADVDRARLQPVVIEQAAQRRVERPLLAVTDAMRNAAAVVHLQAVRHAAGTVQGLAHRGLQAEEVLRTAGGRPLPA